MPQVDPVILQLKADVDKYNADVAGAARLTDQKLNAIEAKGLAMGQGLKKGFNLAATAAVAFVGALSVERVIGGIKASLDYAASLGEIAQAAGVSTDALQEFHYIGTQVNVTAEEMDASLGMFAKRLGEAAGGSKEMLKSYSELGIAIRDSEGNVRPTVDVIEDLADKIAAMKSPAEQAAAATEFFGRAGLKMLPVLLQGSQRMRELRQAAHDLGAVLSADLVAGADEAADKIDALALVMKTQLASAVAQNSAGILDMTNKLVDLINWLGQADSRLKQFQTAYREHLAQMKVQRGLTEGVRREGLNELRQIQGEREFARDWAKAQDEFRRLGLTGPAAARPVGAVTPVPTKPGGGGGGGSTKRTGPSAAEIEREHVERMARLRQDELRARLDLTDDVQERADLERELLAQEFQMRLAELQNDERFQKLKKDKQAEAIAALELLYGRQTKRGPNGEIDVFGGPGLLGQKISRETAARLEREAQELAEARHRAEVEALEAQFDLAKTEAERKDLALQILDAEQAFLRSKLEAIRASEIATEAEKRAAEIALQSLNDTGSARRQATADRHRSPLDEYLARTDPALNGERAEQFIVDELEYIHSSISSAISDAIGVGDDPLISGLIDLLLEQILFRPLAEALRQGADGMGGGGGLFGIFDAIFGGIFGRASGGSVTGGRLYRVNEGAGAGRAEGFIPQGSGNIIPLGRMNAAVGGAGSAQPAIVQVQVVGGELFDVRVQRISGDVSAQVVRAAAPSLIDASAKETIARSNRPRL